LNVSDYDITAVEVAEHGVLELTFADGITGRVDVVDASGARCSSAREPRRGSARCTSRREPSPGRAAPT
jgi:hypothetical protein